MAFSCTSALLCLASIQNFLLIFIINISFDLGTSFPLRRIGTPANLTRISEHRELILCWVVQIHSYGQNECVGLDEEINEVEACWSREQRWRHAAAIAKEVGLSVMGHMSIFQDHYVMCHQGSSVDNKTAKALDYKNLTHHLTHSKHISLVLEKQRSLNNVTFNLLREDVERRLQHHEEVLAFSSEHVHSRGSRNVIPVTLTDLGNPESSQDQHRFVRKQKSNIVQSELKSPFVYRDYKELQNSSATNSISNCSTSSVCLLYKSMSVLRDCFPLSPKLHSFMRDESKSGKEMTCSNPAFSDCFLNISSLVSSYNESAVIKSCCLTCVDYLLSNCSCFKPCPVGTEKAGYYHPKHLCPSLNILLYKRVSEIVELGLSHINYERMLDICSALKDLNLCDDLLGCLESCGVQHAVVLHQFLCGVGKMPEQLSVKSSFPLLSNGSCCSILFNHFILTPGVTVKRNVVKSNRILAVLKLDELSNEGMTFSPDVNEFSLKNVMSSDAAIVKGMSKRSIYSNRPREEEPSLKGSGRSSDVEVRHRVARMAFNDPAYKKQWHLHNHATPAMDINVTGVWEKGITGHGVTVSVVDDGLEWKNPDLQDNYNYKGSWDLNDNDPDPSPSTKKTSNHHGTRCAGEIAAVANNGICGVGVAYGAKVSGLRVLDGVMTDSLEAEAFNKKLDINDIFSCSWGPDDDGRTVDGPHMMAAKAMKYGVDYGRKGYGSIFVVASGNGGAHQDNCNFDGYANSIYTVTIGAVDEDGDMPYYAEECASMLGVTFSSGKSNKRDIVTTDWTLKSGKGCTERHTGTSAAAPLVAGMIALMLEARPCLTWRDVQYILILTASKVDVDLAHWQKNGVGLSHSHKHGFGLLSSWRLVNAARIWKMVPWLTSFSHTEAPHHGLPIPKGKKNPLKVSYKVTARDIRGYSLFTLESVQLTVWMSHPCRGKLSIKLVSPAGTVSIVATPRPKDNSTAGFTDWTFTSVRCWGEQPLGNWTIIIADHDVALLGQGKLTKWRLTLFGTPMTPEEFAERRRKVEAAMSGEFLSKNYTLNCPDPPLPEAVYQPLSERTLKIVVLASAFCFLMAVYETFEYLLCYGEEKKAHSRQLRLTQRALELARENGQARTNPSTLSDNTSNHHGGDDDGDDGEDGEESIFDISESSRLLDPERRERNNISLGNVGEIIPMSTFSVTDAVVEAKCEDVDPNGVVKSTDSLRNGCNVTAS